MEHIGENSHEQKDDNDDGAYHSCLVTCKTPKDVSHLAFFLIFCCNFRNIDFLVVTHLLSTSRLFVLRLDSRIDKAVQDVNDEVND